MRSSLFLACALFASVALAQEPSGFERRARPRVQERPSERLFQQDRDEVNASDALDELLDELAADIARMEELKVAPVLIDRITLSENLSPTFAAILEARLIAALDRSAKVKVVRCLECSGTRSRIEGGAVIVSAGLSQREDLARVAAGYGAKSVMTVALAVEEDAGRMALDVMLTRASDNSVVFAEGYRFESDTSMLYRGADTAQHRADRLRDLEDRINGRPHISQSVVLGAMSVPIEGETPTLLGVAASYRLMERFGVDREYAAGLSVGGFIHSSRLAGALLNVIISRRFTVPSFYSSNFSVGVLAGGFVTGGGGNTPMGGLQLEYLFGHRIAVQASAVWVHPFDLAKKGTMVGGVCPQAGVAFVW